MTPTKTTASPHEEAERLANAAARAVTEANAAQERAEAASKLAEERRQADILAIRRRRLEAFDMAALEADVKASRSRFTDAVRAGEPALLEFVDLQVAMTRRYVVAVEAETARLVVAPERQAIPTGGPSELVYANEVQKVLTHIIANKVEDLTDELEAELNAAGR